MKEGQGIASREKLVGLVEKLAPRHGYNATRLESVRLLRSEAVLNDVPVLYRPGAVFVVQGRKQGMLDDQVYLYDEEHYLAVSMPVPFRMRSAASAECPLLAIYVEFDMVLAAEIAAQVATRCNIGADRPRSLISSRMDAGIRDVLQRLLTALADPVEAAVLGSGILRELYYRVLIGPQGCAMIAALQQGGSAGRIVQSLGFLRENYSAGISVADLAHNAGMSVPSYHSHFKELTGSSPIQYIKAMRLHEARLMIARRGKIADVATAVGYASASQFARDFRRHFGRTASEEMQWVRHHLGEVE